MQEISPARHGSPNGRTVTLGTFILAASSAATLVLLSGCHSAPAASGFVSTSADKAAEQRLRQSDSMPPLQPFDEQFVVVQAPDDAP